MPVQALTEFSADITYQRAEQREPLHGRLYVTDDVIREERYQGQQQEIRIIDLFRGVTLRIDPHREEYQQQDEVLSLPRNPALFCAEMPLLACGFERVERIAERETERWSAEMGISGLSIEITAWYDPQIQYPLRLRLGNGDTLQLSNIEIGRLPSSLFTLPFHLRRVAELEQPQTGGFSIFP